MSIYGLPITTLIFRNYFANIPYEIVEAARIDGAGLWQIFRQIMLPLSLPAFVVVGIFQFTNIWNEFLFGLTVITNPREQPITVALNNLSRLVLGVLERGDGGGGDGGDADAGDLRAARPLLHPRHAGRIDEGVVRDAGTRSLHFMVEGADHSIPGQHVR